jgi:hypothetical protein
MPAARSRRGRLTGCLASSVVSVLLAVPSPAPATEGLHCVLRAPTQVAVGAPVLLRFGVTNRGRQAVSVLEWNTPFEGWFGAYIEVTRDGVALPYRGPMQKRGDPSGGDYLRIGAGQTRRATVDLSLPFDLSLPGLYRVQPRITLHDVAGAAVKTRSRTEHRAQPLPCNAVEVRVGPT